MVIIPSTLPNIVETVGRVAGEALVHSSFLTRDALRNHAEMLHEMTGMRFVTFDALGGIDRWMPILLHAPAIHGVTARTVLAEHPQVRIPYRMAVRAFKTGRSGVSDGLR